MLLKEVQKLFHQELDEHYGKPEVQSFFDLLVHHYLGLERFVLALQPQFSITKEEESLFFAALAKLKTEVPIQYIIGKTTFCGLDFEVNHHVLIPRPETEELVYWILDDVKDKDAHLRILDVGTGSGCIAISLAKNLPNASVVAIDISEEALQVAEENAKNLGVTVHFQQMNALDLWSVDGPFDIIVSNPPYVRDSEQLQMRSNVLNHEPHMALFVKDEDPLLFYKAISSNAVDKLKGGGQLFFEINQYLSREMTDLLEGNHFQDIQLKNDINQNPRMISGSIKKLKSVAVFCGSSEGNDHQIVSEGYKLGQTLAERAITLVYGAGNIGIMGQVAEGALSKQGKTIGVIPDFLKKKEVAHLGLDELIVTENMHERKLKMHELSDGVITLPGGFGTLEELFEMITWAQLGLHQKPIGILNVNGFYDHLMHLLNHMVVTGLLRKENYDMLLIANSIEDLLAQMEAYQPPQVEKWMDKTQT